MEHCAPPIDRDRQRVDDALRVAGAMVDTALARSRERVGGFLLQLRSLHPQATLARGYAIVEKDGVVVRSVRDVKSGDALDVRVSDGAFPARVEPKTGAQTPEGAAVAGDAAGAVRRTVGRGMDESMNAA